jgi:hypothetical protein
MRARHRFSYLADDTLPVELLIHFVAQRERRPLPRPYCLEPEPTEVHQPTGRRIRVVLDGSAPVPVFHGDLPLDAPPACRPIPSAGGCAAADAVSPDIASAVASTPHTTDAERRTA